MVDVAANAGRGHEKVATRPIVAAQAAGRKSTRIVIPGMIARCEEPLPPRVEEERQSASLSVSPVRMRSA
jgi:hypothetical protein